MYQNKISKIKSRIRVKDKRDRWKQEEHSAIKTIDLAVKATSRDNLKEIDARVKERGRNLGKPEIATDIAFRNKKRTWEESRERGDSLKVTKSSKGNDIFPRERNRSDGREL